MSVKVTYILSNINKALAFEWIAEEIDHEKFNISFILLNPKKSAIEDFLLGKGISCTSFKYNGKKELLKAIVSIFKLLKKEKVQIVHCHLFDACIAGLVAAKLAGIEKRIYTRHHATFHQVYFPRAVWYDKFISAMATDVVAISENVKQTLIGEGVSSDKIHLIHHGFKLADFENIGEYKIQVLRQKYNPAGMYPVVGVISRYFELKGIQYIIPAFQKLLEVYPDALLVLANATGNYAAQIQLLLKEIPQKNYIEVTFEPDIIALYQIFDIFIHVPITPSIEAYGQTYVEALAAGVPSVFTLSGVATEFIRHKQNALVVDFKDSPQIHEAMQEILRNTALSKQLTQQGRKDVKIMFELDTMISKLENLYNYRSCDEI